MNRYFIELSYKGTNYSGFQIQQNAVTVQSELEKALKIYLRYAIELTGSSRTDAGVHAQQNYFHFDVHEKWDSVRINRIIYGLNGILPVDIVVRNIYPVVPTANSRFDALSREYKYHVYTFKNAFLDDRGFYLPYKLNVDKLQEAAAILREYSDFTSFSKRNTQVKTFNCTLYKSNWIIENELFVYNVEGNRFLRGMVRALTATMLKVGREKISIPEFRAVIEAKDCTKASFAVPPQGLFLMHVNYPDRYFEQQFTS